MRRKQLLFQVMLLCLFVLTLTGAALAQNEHVGAFELRWSPDGRWIGVGSTNGIWIFDAEDGDAEPYHYADGSTVYVVEFDPVRPYIAFARDDAEQVQVIEIETGREIFRSETPAYEDEFFPVYYDLRYSDDGRRLSVLNASNLFVLDAASGDRISQFSSPYSETYAGSNWLTTLDYGHDNATVLMGDWSANLFVYTPENRRLQGETTLDINDGVGYRLERLESIAGTDQLVVLGWSKLYTYDLEADLLTPIDALEPLDVRGFDLSADGAQVALGTDTRWYLYDTVSEEIVGEFESEFEEDREFRRIYSLAFSPDGELVATAQTDGRLKVWEVATGEVVAELGEFSSGASQKWG